MYTSVHSSVIHNSPKMETAQYPSINEWINKMLYSNAIEYYLTIERNEVLIDATTWMTLENIMLNKKVRHNRPHFILYKISRVAKSIKTKSRLVLRDSGNGE